MNKEIETTIPNAKLYELENGQKRLVLDYSESKTNARATNLSSSAYNLSFTQINRTTNEETINPQLARIDSNNYVRISLSLNSGILPKFARLTGATLEFYVNDGCFSDLSVKSLINNGDYFSVNKQIDTVATYYDEYASQSYSYFNVIKEMCKSPNEEHYFSIGLGDNVSGYLELYTQNHIYLSYRPILIIDYFEYDPFSEGKTYVRENLENIAIYADTLSGKVNVSQKIASTITEKMPVNLTVDYSIDSFDTDSIFDIATGLGKGWKFNYNQYLKQDGQNYVYIDGNNAKHIFKPSTQSGLYYDAGGTGLILKTGTVNEITDEIGMSLFFSSNVLTEIRKTTKRYPLTTVNQRLTYDQNQRLTSITDGANQTVAIEYSDDGVKITNFDGQVVQISINNEGYLKKVTSLHKTNSFNYANGVLNQVYSANDEIVALTYTKDNKLEEVIKCILKSDPASLVCVSKKEIFYEGYETFVKTTTFPETSNRKSVTYSYCYNEEGRVYANYEVTENDETIFGSLSVSEDNNEEKFARYVPTSALENLTFNNGNNYIILDGKNYENDDYLTQEFGDYVSVTNLTVGQDYVLSGVAEIIKGAGAQNIGAYYVELLNDTDRVLCTMLINPKIHNKQFLSGRFTYDGSQRLRARVYIYDIPIQCKFSNIKITPCENTHTYTVTNLNTSDLVLSDAGEWHKLKKLKIKYNGNTVSNILFTEKDLIKNKKLALLNSTQNLWYNDLKSFIPNVSDVKICSNYEEKELLETIIGSVTQRKNDVIISYTVFEGEEFECRLSLRKSNLESDNSNYRHIQLYDECGNDLGSINSEDIWNKYTYNEYGQLIKQEIFPEVDGANYKTVTYENSYSSDGKLLNEKDRIHSTNYLTSYQYNTNGSLSKTTYSNNLIEEYFYNENQELIKLKSVIDSQLNANNFTYANGEISTLSSNGTTYAFEYDSVNRISLVKCNGDVLVSFAYSNFANYDITIATYADGKKRRVTSDIYGRALNVEISSDGVNFASEKKMFYCENESSEIVNVTDVFDNVLKVYNDSKLRKVIDNGVTMLYNYSKDNDWSEVVYSTGVIVKNIYDDFGNVVKVETRFDNSTTDKITQDITYQKRDVVTGDDISVFETSYANSKLTESFSKDYLGRTVNTVKSSGDFSLKETVSYANTNTEGVQDGTTFYPSNYSYSVKIPDSEVYTEKFLELINRDDAKNISSLITYHRDYNLTGNNVSQSVSFKYDKLSRLIRENNQELGVTNTFTYDANGNIIQKAVYPYTTATNITDTATSVTNYTYDSKDRLIGYNGESFSYDANGNPTVYRNNNLVFGVGGRLLSFKESSETNPITFTYDSQGIRKTKTNSHNKTTTYTYIGDKLVREQYVKNNINYDVKFMYTATDLNGLIFEGQTFIYQKNVFGDITGIYDSNGNLCVRYVYDAWGNHKTYAEVNGSFIDVSVGNEYNSSNIVNIRLALYNPFRYRGYYFDLETGLYYLQSRYYDPQVGRFISIDSIKYLAPQTLNGLNLYAYCNNNPVMYSDPSGCIVIGALLKKIVTIAVIAVVTAYLYNKGAVTRETSVANQKTKDSYTKEEAITAIKEVVGAKKVEIQSNQLYIEGANEIRSREQRILVATILTKTVDENGNKFTERSVENLSAEWAGHNFLANSGIYNNPRTQNLNLDFDFNDNAWYTKIGTKILELLGIL